MRKAEVGAQFEASFQKLVSSGCVSGEHLDWITRGMLFLLRLHAEIGLEIEPGLWAHRRPALNEVPALVFAYTIDSSGDVVLRYVMSAR